MFAVLLVFVCVVLASSNMVALRVFVVFVLAETPATVLVWFVMVVVFGRLRMIRTVADMLPVPVVFAPVVLVVRMDVVFVILVVFVFIVVCNIASVVL